MADDVQYIKLPDGSYGKFAANAKDEDIQAAISKDFPDAFKQTEAQQVANRPSVPRAPLPGALQPSVKSKYLPGRAFGMQVAKGMGLDANKIAAAEDNGGQLSGALETGGQMLSGVVNFAGSVLKDPFNAVNPIHGMTSNLEQGIKEKSPGQVLGATSTILGGAEAPSKVAAARDAITPAIAERVRTPSNALTPGTRNVARVGGFIGGMALSPAAKWEAGLVGGALGPTLADAFLPKRTPIESGAPFPSTEDFYSRSGAEQNAIFNRGTKPYSDTARSRSESTTFPQPLRPLIGTPEDWATYERQMDILRPEASDAGTYHAARGATSKKLTLQERMGKKFNQ